MSKTSLKRPYDDSNDDIIISTLTNKRFREALQISAEQHVPSTPALHIQTSYTQSEVDAMLKEALQKQKEEFNLLIDHLLREQYDVFTVHSHDYLSRTVRNNECSYVN